MLMWPLAMVHPWRAPAPARFFCAARRHQARPPPRRCHRAAAPPHGCGTWFRSRAKMRGDGRQELCPLPYLSNSSSMRRAARRQAAIWDFNVPKRGFGKPDVVLEHPVERLVQRARLVDLELVELQPPPSRDRRPSVPPRSRCSLPADVDPVRPHHGEHQKLAAVENRARR